jgi:hypothetical protein
MLMLIFNMSLCLGAGIYVCNTVGFFNLGQPRQPGTFAFGSLARLLLTSILKEGFPGNGEDTPDD